MKNILFIASESVPFIKTGGLADVVGALPKYLDKEKYDVRVVIPNYIAIPARFREQFYYLTSIRMPMGSLGDVYVGIMTYQLEGITYYFIDNEYYFGGNSPYGNIHWDIEKFCFFAQAALSILPTVQFHPDIIHCHDWQAGLVPVLLHTIFQDNRFFRDIRTVMTVHNLRFQGVWDVETIKMYTGLPEWCFTPDRLEFFKDANMLKGGLVFADRITTVSESYAEEITYPFYGEGLDGLMRAKRDTLHGIVNGIDYGIYNPANDTSIAQNFAIESAKEGKRANKLALQRELGLPEAPDTMVVSIISRLTDQKGLDLVEWVIGELVQADIQLVIVGTGDKKYEELFRRMEYFVPERVRAYIAFNEAFAHQVYAGSDAMLMPSLFEPCGLTQLISLRYGTVPIVRETGGLRDTVQPYNEYEQTGTGFSFANYNAHEMLNCIYSAANVYYEHNDAWQGIVQRGMATDYSWASSAQKYAEIYDSLA